MNKNTTISYFISFIIFFIYSLTFFKNIFLAVLLSLIISLKAYLIVFQILMKNNLRTKRLMFREFLDIFNTNIIAGNNFYNSLKNTSIEIKNIFYEKIFIVKYLDNLILDIDNGNNIIDSLLNFKEKCDLEEVDIFVESIIIAVKSGLDISKMTDVSKDMLTENISLELEIATLVNNAKREFLIMTILPVIILFLVNFSNTQVLNFTDYMVRVPVFIIFLFSFYIGYKIVNLEI